MKKRWTVEITAEDIAKGRPFCPVGCPAAIAIRRAIGQEAEVSVGGASVGVFLSGGEDYYVWTPSASLTRWIRRFDVGVGVKPGRFCLTIPIKVQANA